MINFFYEADVTPLFCGSTVVEYSGILAFNNSHKTQLLYHVLNNRMAYILEWSTLHLTYFTDTHSGTTK